MASYYGKRERRVIPRWRAVHATSGTAEGQPLNAREAKFAWSEATLTRAAQDWKARKDIFVATELVGVAYTLRSWGYLPAVSAAKYLVSRSRQVPAVSLEVATEFLARSENVPPKERSIAPADPIVLIRRLKEGLVLEPKNPIARVELARIYASIGQKDQARREIDRALMLASAHRFVARAAARFFVHLELPDRAHQLLRSNPLTKHDPWLVAAEIAVADVAGATPLHLKLGKQMLSGKRYQSSETSELASALGTIELEHGNVRVAKRLFQQAMLDPTDNSIAQAEWATERLGRDLVESRHLIAPLTYEARALDAYQSADWTKAFEQAHLWLEDEPFSSRPAMLGSFVAAVGTKSFEDSARIAETGLKANPKDPGLLNNLIFALANQGRLDDATAHYKEFGSLPLAGSNRVLFLATGGLIEFRQGRPDSGRALYGQAIDEATKQKSAFMGAGAAAYYVIEEARVGNIPVAREVFSVAERLAKSGATPGLEEILAMARAELIAAEQKVKSR